MADTKTLEREYVIPLRRHWLHVPHYERTGKAIKAIKIFIAKHMKVEDRNVNNVKLDVYLNNDLWFKGRANPPSKVKVKAKKDKDIVLVTFVETPEHVKFLQARHLRIHKKAEKKNEKAGVTPQAAHATPEKTEEQKTDEKEKEKAVAEHNLKEAEKTAKVQKHVTKSEKAQHPHRMALKK
ncbi:MAG TPA: 50S ribosomal protein L31e [Candidatus Nanoarchaeia archaeon]|nr:50S ribosomal protein L31e [Candidatus Nanoarchaeia archaeon]